MRAQDIDQQQVQSTLTYAFPASAQYIGFPPPVLQAKEWLEKHYPCDDAVWSVAQTEDNSINASLSVIPGTGKENDEFNR